MIFTGDIACPNEDLALQLRRIFTDNPTVFAGKSIFGNFEGMISDDTSLLSAEEPCLFNHSTVPALLAEVGFKGVGLANNHALDLPAQYDVTINALQRQRLAYSGIGRNKEAAYAPALMEDDGHKMAVFSTCWDFLLYHQNNPDKGVYVAETREVFLLEHITSFIQQNTGTSVVVYVHWSFDLEVLPFPMYRQWAKALIDAGVRCVVGCHSHCVQGGEQYKNGYIVYGLGNFFLPNHVYANGKLHFPAMSKTQLVFEWSPATNRAQCHWFEYTNQSSTVHEVTYTGTEAFADATTLQRFSPYQNMDEATYLDYFKRHRRKKILIPVYKNYQSEWKNSLKTTLLKNRAKIARFLAKTGLIGWQN